MKSTSLKKIEHSPNLKLIKTSVKKLKRVNPKMYINTLIPGFNYVNSSGEVTIPSTHIII